MKSLTTYVSEAMDKWGELVPDFQFNTEDLMKYGVWAPADDIKKIDSYAINKAFYKKYPADFKDICGMVAGYPVMCQYNVKPMVLFKVFCDGASDNDKIAIVEEIVDFLSNEVPSKEADRNIKRNIKKMIDKK